jgi:G3E family GTPase
VCCTLRGDLADELRDLLSRRERGEIPSFRRVVVETTGLADPAPIVYTLLSEPVVRHHYKLETVVATVDAVNGLRHEESLKQAAIADTLVVTKCDIAEASPVVSRLEQLNPTAEVIESSFGDVEPARLFERPARDPRDVTPSRHSHEEDIHAVCLFLDDELDWTAFGVWLTMLLQARGEDVLRVKGLLNVGAVGPVLVNGVQHAVHPPVHLGAWADEDRRSRIVFIGRGFDGAELERSLAVFNAAARS